jgi:cytochrome c-type biogenesis protein CcmH/NrfG
VQSTPERVFDRAALAAVKRWRFEPLAADGEAAQATIETTVLFKMDDTRALTRHDTRSTTVMRLPNERTRNLASTLGILALLVAFIGVVLVPGFRLASDLSRTTATLKLVSEQRAQPEVMARTLASLRDQLEAGHYVGKTLEEIARHRGDV